MTTQILKYACYAWLGLNILASGSCKKQDSFLDTKPDEALAVPSTLADLQSLLQYEGLFNINDPALGEIGTDDFYTTTANWNTLTSKERNCYIWAKQVYDAGANVNDWSAPYQQVYYANTVLDNLPKISFTSNQSDLANQIKGAALFYRSIAFYNLLQTFSLPYDSLTAATDPGIPLRLSSNLNGQSVRATEKQCYDQIISDLLMAADLLPLTPAYKTEPSQPAANALLARIYLATQNYSKAFQYADACLKQYNTLVDYNTLSPTAKAISTTYLAEDIFHTRLYSYAITFVNSKSVTDSLLYRSYTDNDLRKIHFFILNGGLPYFRGSYNFLGSNPFSGIATDEVYLARAECYARLGNKAAAMNDLNALLITRWKTGTFIPYTAVSAENALQQILLERRKELLYRGLRWTDLRRLNKDSRFANTLTRVINGVVYTLAPNDPRYALPIPDNEIAVSGIAQNLR